MVENVLIKHLNTSHSELEPGKALEMIGPDGDLEFSVDLVNEYEFPMTFSMSGIDARLIMEVNPELAEKIRDSKYISLTQGLMSHALMTRMPAHLDHNLKEGQEALFGLSEAVMDDSPLLPGEFDYAPLYNSPLGKAGVNGVILNHDVNNYYERKSLSLNELPEGDRKPSGTLVDAFESEMPFIASNLSNTRGFYLAWLRGFGNPQDIVNLMEKDREEFKDSSYLVDVNDFEAIGFNDGREEFRTYLEALKNSRIPFSNIRTSQIEEAEEVTHLAQRNKFKWRDGFFNDAVTGIQRDFNFPEADPYHRMLYLLSLRSDEGSANYCTNVTLHKKDGSKVIIKSDPNRIAENMILARTIENKSSLLTELENTGLPQGSKDMLAHYHNIAEKYGVAI